MSTDILDKLWVEKYRPRTLDDVVLEPDQKSFLQKCIRNGDIPHILMTGPAGSGKTTTSLIVKDAIIKDDMDVLELNGSDDTGVSVVRDTIKSFLKTPPMASPHKIVFIDEFDYMTTNAQASLRNIMETYAKIGRFICTGNYKSKIIEPLQSRFQIFEMKTISEQFALDYCCKILTLENIQYDKENIRMIVQTLSPDMRKMINTIQKNIVDGKLQNIDKALITSIEKKIIGLISIMCDEIGGQNQKRAIDVNIGKLHEIMAQGQPEYIMLYEHLFNNEKLPIWAKIAVNKYANTHNSAALPQMHFIAMVWEIIQNGSLFYKTFGKS